MITFELGAYEYFEDESIALLRHGPHGRRVLDVGCGSGLLGARLRERGNVVWGLDEAHEIAELAARRLDRFVLVDVLDHERVAERLGDERFDVIVFADVLEHLPDPIATLRSYRRFLAPGGEVLVSVPNVAIWNVRLGLLRGRFEYTATGALDRTHLRFFTRASLLRALRDADLHVETIDINPGVARAFAGAAKQLLAPNGHGDRRALLDSRPYRLYRRLLYPLEYRAARSLPGLLAFQNVVVARAAERTEAPATPTFDDVAVVMITMNEERSIRGVARELRRAVPGASVTIVDSSSDRTPAIAAAEDVTVIRQFPPRGYGPAMTAALHHPERPIVVTLDCDGTYPTERIPELVELVRRGCDVAGATRLARGRPRAMPWPNYLANRLFNLAASILFLRRVHDVHSGMRAYRRAAIEAFAWLSEPPALPVELLLLPIRAGMSVRELPIAYSERVGDTTLERLSSTMWTFRRILRTRVIPLRRMRVRAGQSEPREDSRARDACKREGFDD